MTACASTPRSTSGTSTGNPVNPRPTSATAGRSWPGSTTRSARASRGRSRSPRTSRATPGWWRPTAEGGAGFGAQWDPVFIYDVRPALVAADDADRDMAAVAAAIFGRGSGRAADAGSSTRSRTTTSPTAPSASRSRSRPATADSWWAKKRAVLGSVLVLTSPGIPMLFQGQELLEDRWFDDTVAPRLGQGALQQRDPAPPPRPHRAPAGEGRGDARVCGGPNARILRADNEAKVLAMHRWQDGGPHDDTVVVANFADRTIDDLRIGLPAPGRWSVRLNLDSAVYAPEFGGHEVYDLDADGGPLDGCAAERPGLAWGRTAWWCSRGRTRGR